MTLSADLPLDRDGGGEAAIDRQDRRLRESVEAQGLLSFGQGNQLFTIVFPGFPVEQRQPERNRHRLLAGLSRRGRDRLLQLQRGGLAVMIEPHGDLGRARLLVPAAELAEVEAGAASVLNGLGFTKDSVRVGEVAFVAPFRYTILIWAILLGVVIFGDIPDAWTLLGASVIVATGIFTFYRERRLSRRMLAAAVAQTAD